MLCCDGQDSTSVFIPATTSASDMDHTLPTNGAATLTYPRHIWIVAGTAGCGKSTVGEYLAKEMILPYIEGDDVSNIL